MMIFPRVKKNKGYALAEIIIYIAIFSLLSVLITNSLITMTRGFAHAKSNRDILGSGLLAMERMTREIKDARSVNLSASVFNVNSGILSLNGLTQAGSNRTVRFYLDNEILEMEEDASYFGALSLPSTAITGLTFNFITTPAGEAVKIVMTVEDKRSGRSETFYGTAILRQSY